MSKNKAREVLLEKVALDKARVALDKAWVAFNKARVAFAKARGTEEPKESK